MAERPVLTLVPQQGADSASAIGPQDAPLGTVSVSDLPSPTDIVIASAGPPKPLVKPVPAYLQPPPKPENPLGTVALSEDGQSWVIEAEPQITEMAKRLFHGSRALGHGRAVIPATKRNIGDLNWLMMRFPLALRPEHEAAYMAQLRAAQQHSDTLALALEKPQRISPKMLKKPWPFQEEGIAHLVNNRRTLLADAPGLGKAQPLDAKVLTPSGWRLIGDVRVGDDVSDPMSGKRQKVVGVFPQGMKPVFRVEFNDGASTECCDDHLWQVSTCSQRRRGSRPSVRKLSEIRSRLHDSSGKRLHYVPMVVPSRLDCGALRPLDPFLLGALLGDGGMTGHTPTISKDAPDLMDEVRRRLPEGLSLVPKVGLGEGTDWFISGGRVSTPNPVTVALRSLGLWGRESHEKFVPEAYLFAPVSVRLALLRGIMDTDGWITDGVVGFSSSSKAFSDAVAFLVQSFGGCARRSTKTNVFYKYKGERKRGRPAHILTIAMPDDLNPFLTGPKAAAWRPREKYKPARCIASVEPVGAKECVCIRVENEHGLYVTDDFIVTHNTLQAIGFLVHTQSWPALVIVPPHLVLNWAGTWGGSDYQGELEKFLGKGCTVHVIRGHKPYPLPLAHVYVMHYLLLTHWRSALRDAKIGTVVFDEIQDLRHHETAKYSAASEVASLAENVIGLSGTPICNHGAEIWAVLNILEFNCLGNREAFTREHCTHYGGKIVTDPEVLSAHLKREGLFLRRRAEDPGVLPDLPRKRRVIQQIGMDDALYAPLIEQAVAAAAAVKDAKSHIDAQRLRRIAIEHSRQAIGVAKAPYVAAFVQALLEAEEPVLLFAHHHAVFAEYTERLKEWHPAEITGRDHAKDPKVRKAAEMAFERGETNLLIIGMRAGTGINLPRGRIVVFGELDFTPAVHTQCEDRSAGGLRAAGKDSVLAYYLVCPDGADREILDCLGLKVSQFVGVMGDKPETEEDKALAERMAEKHMSTLLARLQAMGKLPKPPVLPIDGVDEPPPPPSS